MQVVHPFYYSQMQAFGITDVVKVVTEDFLGVAANQIKFFLIMSQGIVWCNLNL